MIRVAVTGASGTMGQEAIPELMKNPDIELRLLMHNSKRGRRTAAAFKKQYKDRIEIFFGDVRTYEDCRRLCEGADYLIHMAAVIPPLADHDAALTMTTNRDGTRNLINAVQDGGDHTKFIHISTVAVYGHRNEKHPWGRVGDPLITSALDVYGQSKTIAEFSVIESGISEWVVLRQTGVLYDNIMMNNISDGLMFHTPWNIPIEWVTAKDSAILLSNMIKRDAAGEVPGFWRQVYNIGGGENARVTGYETFDYGFKLIGGSAKQVFAPNWNPTRNFHCFWFSDSDRLEELFHFRTQGFGDFWEWYGKRHRIYAAGRLAPAGLIKKLAIERLFKNTNAPAYWLKHNDEARLQAFFGGRKELAKVPARWEDFSLYCESPECEADKAQNKKGLFSHGYDDSKNDSEISLEDLRQAAEFRGGKCISDEMKTGDLYDKILWCCNEGHAFEASPYAILRAGHWCPECCQSEFVWQMDRVAAHSPFHAQAWLDSHDADECFIYSLVDGEAKMEEVK